MNSEDIIFARVEIKDLERLGWTFDGWDQQRSYKQEISLQDIDYNRKKYIATIAIELDGKTIYDWEERETREGSEWVPTGNDEKMMKDLKTLLEEGKLWDVVFYEY